jgi:hypothetical protein
MKSYYIERGEQAKPVYAFERNVDDKEEMQVEQKKSKQKRH